MTANTIADIHDALGVTPEDLTALKAVRLVWKKLESSRLKAEKGQAKDLVAYRDLLQKNLVAARKVQAVPDAEQASKGFWDWYQGQLETRGVERLERLRGSGHQHWCEKWLKTEYDAFSAAIARTVLLPSQVNFEEAKGAAEAMLQAYATAFQEN